MNEAEAKKLLNRRIKYARSGSRAGWEGTLVKVSAHRIQIDYDNGVEQDYSLSALMFEGEVFVHGSYTYLAIMEEAEAEPIKSSKSATNSIPKKSWLVINMSTGSVVGCAIDEKDADSFAKEQAEDSSNHTVFTVFRPKGSFVIKRPLAERITSMLLGN